MMLFVLSGDFVEVVLFSEDEKLGGEVDVSKHHSASEARAEGKAVGRVQCSRACDFPASISCSLRCTLTKVCQALTQRIELLPKRLSNLIFNSFIVF